MTAMKERAVVGSRWIRRRDKTTWTIVQSHRKDRLAELVPAERTNAHKEYVRFADLRRRYEQVEP